MTLAAQRAARSWSARQRRLAVLKARRCPRCQSVPVKVDAVFRPDGAIVFQTQCRACETDITVAIPAAEVGDILPA